MLLRTIIKACFILLSCSVFAQNNTSVDKLNRRWLKQVNKGDSTITLLYKHTTTIILNGRLTNATDTITKPFEQLKNYSNKLKKLEVVASEEHTRKHIIQLQRVVPNLDGKAKAVVLTAWEFKEEEYHKSFEIIDTTNIDSSLAFNHIDSCRNQWQRLANKGSYKQLTKELYSPDATYYYKDSTFNGHDLLNKKFGYMKGSDWFARVKPTSVVTLDKGTVVEFGKYYSRKRKTLYVFVWQRVKNTNEWLITHNFEF